MAEESRGQYREFQLETRHLAAIVVLIAILCISSFLLGRWVERQAYRATTDGGARSGASGSPTVEDVNKELTYFRTLEEDAPPPKVQPSAAPGKAPPVRVEQKPEEVATSAAPEARASTTTPAAAPPTASIFIQVMATKDAAAAAALKSRLSSKGYPVGVSPGSGGAESGMRRVKVGPYSGRTEAEKVAKRLRAEEGLRTWIP